MPWWETNAMEQRMRFVMECLEPAANVAEICREYEIAQSTGQNSDAVANGHGNGNGHG